MSTSNISIRRSDKTIWLYLTSPDNWEKWWNTAIKKVTPAWQENAVITWEQGATSILAHVIPQQSFTLYDATTETLFKLIPSGENTTVVVESRMRSDVPPAAPGAEQPANLDESLARLKDCLERETSYVPDTNLTSSSDAAPKSSNRSTALIIGAVVLAILVLCCCLAAGVALYFYLQGQSQSEVTAVPTVVYEVATEPVATLRPPSKATPEILPTRPEKPAFTPEKPTQQPSTGGADFMKWSLLKLEKFDDNQSDWAEGDEGNDEADITWTLDGGKYRWDFTSKEESHVWWVWPDKPYKDVDDFYAAVDITPVEDAQNSDYGLLFRRYSDDDLCSFRIAVIDKVYIVECKTNGEWNTLIDWTDSPEIADGTNHIGMTAVGDHFAFYINSIQVGEVDYDAPGPGAVGLMMGVGDLEECVVDFDNFEVRTP